MVIQNQKSWMSMSLPKLLVIFVISLVLCLFGADRALNSQSMQQIDADHPKIQYIGRIDRTNAKAPVLSFPGSAFRFKFEGTTLGLKLADDTWGGNNYVGVYIDNNPQPTVIYLDSGSTVKDYLVSDQLAEARHTALVVKRNDYITGGFSFHGISLAPQKNIFELHTLSNRKIEVYGDSISAGGSVEYEQTGVPDPQGNNDPLANGYLSFGSMLARDYQAQVHLIAQGGMPLIDGYGFWNQATGMEAVYDKMAPLRDAPTWDFSKYQAKLVIVALGQNDASSINESQLSSQEWQNRYQQFIANLRSKQPHAYIICMFPNMFHDTKWDGYLTAAVAQYQQATGDNRVYTLINQGITPGHPREAEQRMMADALSNLIETRINPDGLNWSKAAAD
jgi:lysophospholipase L1-like esterase